MYGLSRYTKSRVSKGYISGIGMAFYSSGQLCSLWAGKKPSKHNLCLILGTRVIIVKMFVSVVNICTQN